MFEKPTYEELEEKAVRAERALRESQELLILLTEQTLLSIVILQDGSIVYANKAYSELTGYPIEEILNWRIEDTIKLIHPDFQKFVFSQGHKKMDGIITSYQYKGIKKSGKEGWIDQYSKTIKFNGKPADMICMIEITDHRRVERKLLESEIRFRELSEMLPEVVFETDRNIELIYANQRAFDLFGYSVEDLQRGLNGIDLIVPEDRDRVITDLANRLKGESPEITEYQALKKDGSNFPILFHANSIMKKGKLKGLRGIIIDISDRKRAEEEQKKLQDRLTQAQKMESIGTLAGGIAHDFNNILFTVLGHTEILMMDTPKDSPAYDRLKKLYAGAIRARNLVKQILTFSRQDNFELKNIQLQPIVEEVLVFIRATIPTAIEIRQDISNNCANVKADSTQIHQIVMNLTTNAYHAMEETGGELKVSLKEIEFGMHDIISPDMKSGTYVCLSVADTGIGMDKELTGKIFDPFFTTKEKGKGTGMGLSVVHGIVAGMNGFIQADSEQGKGTEFHVYFPIEKNSLKKQATHSKTQIQGGTEQILIVDDEEEILTMEKQMLERLGYQVTFRVSSLEALEAFRANPDRFDLVITDMAMPNMSGDKLSAELAKIRSDIPVLLCTGFSETMSEEKATSLGIKGFLLKPIVIKDLAQKIREALDGN